MSRKPWGCQYLLPFAHYAPKGFPSGSTTIKYYFFGGMRIAMMNGSTFSYLHADHLGSTVLETNTSGNLSADQKYRAYGNQRDSGPVVTDHKFTGQKLDGTGLYYYNARVRPSLLETAKAGEEQCGEGEAA